MLTGVSGSGKSTLLSKCLYEPYQRLKRGLSPAQLRRGPDAVIDELKGLSEIADLVLIDQSPIGRSPRSNPATYTKAWDIIRECLAETPAAERLGLSKSAFSFNVDGGRCPVCSGAGHLRVEMQFLADVFVECEACGGTRFQDSVLSVRYAGKNVVDLLSLSLEEALVLFEGREEESRSRKLRTCLQPLVDLGLGYLSLGHPLNTVSGGEAQRVKLASYLRTETSEPSVFILDEPTSGLHPANIDDLLATFRELISRGHTVFCVEHNLDVLSQADWLIDLGPDGGERGGEILAQGWRDELLKSKIRSETLDLLREANNPRRDLDKTSKKPLKVKQEVSSKSSTAIEVVGAREHNLKNINARIEHNALTVLSGVSGSGKSTLAFDIVFAEGQRRYIDCLSPYARQYIKQLSRADVDRVRQLPPTIAVSQKTAPPLGVSTIATNTEIYQYLRLLFSKAGTQHCVHDNTPVSTLSAEAITEMIAKRFIGKRVFLHAPVVSGRKGFYADLFQRALKAEITEARIDGEMVHLEPGLRLARHKLHWISLQVASLSKPEQNRDLLEDAVRQSLLLGNGVVEVFAGKVVGEPALFSTDRVCPTCGRGYRELDPQDFSFRSARGVCQVCGGRGFVTKGAGVGDEVICSSCQGARIAPIGRHVYVDGKSIYQLVSLGARDLLDFLNQVKFESRYKAVVEPLLRELKSRLSMIISVGLDYLNLDRDAHSISGGEAQRLRLAKTLGSPLSGVCYVLDEPSIGLHPEDHSQLMETLFALRDAGNTVVVVEHDENTIRQADCIIDIGPGGGTGGGRIVAQGGLSDILAAEHSQTGRALRERGTDLGSFQKRSKVKARHWIEISGVSANNLQDISLRIPHQSLSVVAGVSGAGKSSLVHGALVPAIVQDLEGEKERAKFYQKHWLEFSGLEPIDRFVEIDQTPLGRTSTSCPASYLGIFNDIRKIYAMLPEAKARGWNASHFSYNTGKGRCPECQGKGFVTVPMSFLPDARTSCETCRGLRYNEQTLEVHYQNISLGELLQKTFTDARDLLSNHRKICRSLDYVLSLGLGYLSLGQPTYTLSGGEAQRLKIAKELGLREAVNTLYILDEPTIGLHMTDVDKLLEVLRLLIEKGNTVLLIEHDLDLIRAADYLVELGPGPGEQGGRILFSGTPEELVKGKLSTPTSKHLVFAQ